MNPFHFLMMRVSVGHISKDTDKVKVQTYQRMDSDVSWLEVRKLEMQEVQELYDV